jgi:hypothetical protein
MYNNTPRRLLLAAPVSSLIMVLVAPNTQSSGRESGKQWMRFMGSGRKKIRGFGSFSVREYKAYKSRNPKTGKNI